MLLKIIHSLKNIFLHIQFSWYKVISLYHLVNGDGEIRTLDPLLARQVLSQLSYAPIISIPAYLICNLKTFILNYKR